MHTQLSIFIAKTIGIVYFAFGIGFLLNGDYYKKGIQKVFDDFGFVISWSVIALVMGYVIISYHNVWGKDWPVLITLIGYIAFIEGVALICFPTLLSLFKPLLRIPHIEKLIVVASFLAGSVFAYFGFFSQGGAM